MPMHLHSVKIAIDESVSSVSMWNIVNQLGKHYFFVLWLDFSNGKVLNLKERKLFPDQINRNHIYLILGRRDRNCCTMENLTCLNSSVNETIL